MKVLIGTTNPAKVTRVEEFLPDCGIEFLKQALGFCKLEEVQQ